MSQPMFFWIESCSSRDQLLLFNLPWLKDVFQQSFLVLIACLPFVLMFADWLVMLVVLDPMDVTGAFGSLRSILDVGLGRRGRIFFHA